MPTGHERQEAGRGQSGYYGEWAPEPECLGKFSGNMPTAGNLRTKYFLDMDTSIWLKGLPPASPSPGGPGFQKQCAPENIVSRAPTTQQLGAALEGWRAGRVLGMRKGQKLIQGKHSGEGGSQCVPSCGEEQQVKPLPAAEP